MEFTKQNMELTKQNMELPKHKFNQKPILYIVQITSNLLENK